ncbi:DUF45 domain-containing protein [candidate division TA06 bacterium]|nr:DUF45 domain-containing protein [candidate division TA06 bacterium]
MPNLNVNGRSIPYNISRKDIRHIYLKIGSDLRLEISIPKNQKLSIPLFLKKKSPWIEKKIKEMSQMKRLFNKKAILYKGEPIKVKVFQVGSAEGGVRNVKRNRGRKGVRLYKKVLHLYENPERKWHEILKEFVAQMTLQSIKRDSNKWGRRLGVEYSSLHIKDMKIWGYCKNNGDLYFNSKLICLPENLRNYVVLHELLHLKHFDHSEKYKRELSKYFINYKQAERLLKSYLSY